jgi:hypothetical protein
MPLATVENVRVSPRPLRTAPTKIDWRAMNGYVLYKRVGVGRQGGGLQPQPSQPCTEILYAFDHTSSHCLRLFATVAAVHLLCVPFEVHGGDSRSRWFLLYWLLAICVFVRCSEEDRMTAQMAALLFSSCEGPHLCIYIIGRAAVAPAPAPAPLHRGRPTEEGRCVLRPWLAAASCAQASGVVNTWHWVLRATRSLP